MKKIRRKLYLMNDGRLLTRSQFNDEVEHIVREARDKMDKDAAPLKPAYDLLMETVRFARTTKIMNTVNFTYTPALAEPLDKILRRVRCKVNDSFRKKLDYWFFGEVSSPKNSITISTDGSPEVEGAITESYKELSVTKSYKMLRREVMSEMEFRVIWVDFYDATVLRIYNTINEYKIPMTVHVNVMRDKQEAYLSEQFQQYLEGIAQEKNAEVMKNLESLDEAFKLITKMLSPMVDSKLPGSVHLTVAPESVVDAVNKMIFRAIEIFNEKYGNVSGLFEICINHPFDENRRSQYYNIMISIHRLDASANLISAIKAAFVELVKKENANKVNLEDAAKTIKYDTIPLIIDQNESISMYAELYE